MITFLTPTPFSRSVNAPADLLLFSNRRAGELAQHDWTENVGRWLDLQAKVLRILKISRVPLICIASWENSDLILAFLIGIVKHWLIFNDFLVSFLEFSLNFNKLFHYLVVRTFIVVSGFWHNALLNWMWNYSKL